MHDHDHEFRAPLDWWEVRLSNGAWFDIRAMGFGRVGDSFEFNSAAVGEPNNYLVPSAVIQANTVCDIQSNYGDRRPNSEREQPITPTGQRSADHPATPDTDTAGIAFDIEVRLADSLKWWGVRLADGAVIAVNAQSYGRHLSQYVFFVEMLEPSMGLVDWAYIDAEFVTEISGPWETIEAAQGRETD
jgi:hypothetical protein